MEKCYSATWESIRTHTIPKWYEDDKFGIFIHWGLYSVPSFAPMSAELGEIPTDEGWFCNNPYAEWYFNSVNVGRGPSYEHHTKKYGADFKYERFADMWKAELWEPSEWASLFKEAGAKYVILTAKHHDGMCLYNTALTSYNTTQTGPCRDIMGELTEAVRKEGLRMGAYYSGMLDWHFCPEPIFNESQNHTNGPATYEYSDYAYKQARELTDLYKPSVLWGDIGWPAKGREDIPHLLAHYFNTVQEGVTNDRWSGLFHDFRTKEYKYGEAQRSEKWEMCRGMALSFGYNAYEKPDYLLTPLKLISLLVSTVANNGNLLLNVGPKADGVIPLEQQELLRSLGRWLSINGDAIYGTRITSRVSQQKENGLTLHYTKKGKALFVLTDGLHEGENTFVIDDIEGSVHPLDPEVQIFAEATANGTRINVDNYDINKGVLALKFST